MSGLERARETVVETLSLVPGKERPILVAFDGGSGAGKTTLAREVAEHFGAAYVGSDDFYASWISNAEWDARSASERVAEGIDWRRLRADALEPLLAGQPGRWQPFDHTRPAGDGTYPLREEWTECAPADVIVLDGAYSCRPELEDLVDLSVLVECPLEVRHARLAEREAATFLAAWHARWDPAEAYYFSRIRPASCFALVVSV